MTLYSETLKAIKPLLKSGAYSLYRANKEYENGGPKVQELESLFCSYHEVRHAVAVSSATAGLHTAILACNLQGKQIITTPVTFSATASSILMAGARLGLHDVESRFYGLAPVSAPYLLPVHLHGHPADMDTLKALTVIEDASQALGAIYKGRKVGTIGNVGIFSFNQSKQLNSGEGGMIITNDDAIAEKCRLIRNHGETQANILGYNYRMTELQAAVLIPQFNRLEKTIADTIELCERVTGILSTVEELVPPLTLEGCRHVYYTYPLKVRGLPRDKLQDRLRDKGIFFGKGGYTPLYHFPFYREYAGNYPVAEDCYQTVMFTNIFRPPMKIKEAERIARVIKETVWQSKKDSTIS